MTVIDPSEAILYAVYPFVLVGAPIAAWLCGWTAWKLRKLPVALWWFLVGITLISIAVAVDAGWYVLYRLQSDHLIWVGKWVDRGNRNTFPFHATLRVFIAIPLWIFAITTIGVLRGQSQSFGWTKQTLGKAAIRGFFIYFALVGLIYWLLSMAAN